MYDADLAEWFGTATPIGDWPADQAASYLREVGDDALGDELVAYQTQHPGATFGARKALASVFNRFMATTNVCGFLPAQGTDRLLPVSKAAADPALVGTPLRVTLDSLHVAKYPGKGTHTMLFDFALQSQPSQDSVPVYHYNAKFRAGDGETVPVHDFPLFHGFSAAAEGIVFGFQIINLESSFNKGLLDFLDTDEFKLGLSLLNLTPVLGQISQMCAGMARWLAGQSANAPVQAFRQGLGFATSPLSGRLAEGYYVVAQIPVEFQREWNWDDWLIDPVLQCLVQRDGTTVLDFNHFIFGLHRQH
jgi:hypothetical protein